MNIINTKSDIKSIKFSVTKMIMEYLGDLFNKHSSFAGDFQCFNYNEDTQSRHKNKLNYFVECQ